MSTNLRRIIPVRLSVIIATLSRLDTAKLLASRIREILPAFDIEVIVVTPVIVERDAASEFVRYVADVGGGVYAAYNAALQTARGEYVWFIGDDDYPLDATRGVIEALEAGEADLIVAPVVFSSGRVYSPTRSLLLLHFLNWCQQGVIYRREVLLRYKFHQRLTVQADQYSNILMRSNRGLKKQFLAQPICVFGVTGLSGRRHDAGYRALRSALAWRTLGAAEFLAFRLLTSIEPLVKRVVKLR
jgi:glycosyltransferase involved in cell wall biosynthesis